MTVKPSNPRGPAPRLRLLALAALLLAGCGERVDTAKRIPYPGTGGVAGPPPVVRDLDAIQTEGVLRMITVPGPLTCMVFEGHTAGYEYEMLNTFCVAWNLRLEPVFLTPGEDPVRLLNEGRGDVVAMGVLSDPSLAVLGAATRALEHTRLQLVRGAHDGDGVVVLPGRSWAESARTALPPDAASLTASPQLGVNDLLRRTAAGLIDATVAPDYAVRAAIADLEVLEVAGDLGEPRDLCWLTRGNAPELLTALNHFLSRHLGPSPTGLRRSRTFGVLHDRYVDDPAQIRYYRRAEARLARSGRICEWDGLIREAADAHGVDWLTVAALVFEESRFDPTLVSGAGAVGLMQVMPRYADKDSTQLHDPRMNVEFGVRHLEEILGWYDYLAPEDRWPFTLATYHAGTGHMNDARRIAMDAGLDPNRWEGHVVLGLKRLRDARHVKRTRHGYYRGDRSVRYAESILRRTALYRAMLERFETMPE